MAKRKTHFEQVPVERVRKIAKLDLPDTKQDDALPVKATLRSERMVSGKQVASKRAAI
jgi:hypothetical protein